MRREFSSRISRLGSVLTPDRIIILDSEVVYKRRNSFLIGYEVVSIPFSRVASVVVEQKLLGATLRIVGMGTNSIEASNFSWQDANEIKKLIMSRL